MSKMRQQRTMQTDTPSNTALTLQRVEKAAGDAIDDLDNDKSNRFNVVSVNNGSTCQAKPWDFVVASGGSYVNLPSATPQLDGAQIAVVSADASTIRIIPLNAKLRGAASLNYSSQAQATFICDGANWW